MRNNSYYKSWISIFTLSLVACKEMQPYTKFYIISTYREYSILKDRYEESTIKDSFFANSLVAAYDTLALHIYAEKHADSVVKEIFQKKNKESEYSLMTKKLLSADIVNEKGESVSNIIPDTIKTKILHKYNLDQNHE